MDLNDWLHQMGLSQKDFAELIDRTPATVSRIVNGINRPDGETMSRIAEATSNKVTPNDFYDLGSNDRISAHQRPLKQSALLSPEERDNA